MEVCVCVHTCLCAFYPYILENLVWIIYLILYNINLIAASIKFAIHISMESRSLLQFMSISYYIIRCYCFGFTFFLFQGHSYAKQVVYRFLGTALMFSKLMSSR